MADQNRIVVTSQISTRLQRSRQQVSNPVSSIIHAETPAVYSTKCTTTARKMTRNVQLQAS